MIDRYKLFKGCCIAAIVIGGISCLVCAGIFLFSYFLTASSDSAVQGGVTFFVALALLFPVAAGVISILAGKAGLQGDPYLCKKMSIISAGIMVLSLLSSFRTGSVNFLTVLETAFYCVFAYLAHTEAY